MRKIITSNQFKKDLEIAKKRNLDLNLLEVVVIKLAKNEKLPPSNKDHPLKGKFTGLRECHIKPNWLLIYSVDDNELELFLIRTESRSDLFK